MTSTWIPCAFLANRAADCAERVLPIYQAAASSDTRPHEAIAAIREFSEGGKRAAKLRKLSMDAYRAAQEMDTASAAAQSASLAASSAYTHSLVDVAQTKHIVGPAAYAALVMEIKAGRNTEIGEYQR